VSPGGPEGGGTPLRVELYGIARSRTGRDAVVIPVPPGATLGDALALLAGPLPELVGPVIGADRRSLVAGNVASVDGREFLRDPAAVLPAGKPLLLLPASAGG
jgi:molybdopterin converting factor small subunit